MKKTEKRFIIGLLVFTLLLWGAMALLRPGNYGSVRIEINGHEAGTYSLQEDQIISIGDTNTCEIRDGKVFMIHAECPDQLCIRQGAIDASGGMIVCLPNKITIEGVKKESSDTDVDSIS